MQVDGLSAVDEPLGLGSSTGELANNLLQMAQQAKALELLAHLVHLNYEGEEFLEIHAFLKGRYEAHLEQFDALAEFVRTLDYLVPWDLDFSLCQLEHCPGAGSTAAEQLLCYLKCSEAFGLKAKELAKCARSADAPDVENYAADLVADAFKTAWFLKATLRQG